jgi:hypothetical protein
MTTETPPPGPGLDTQEAATLPHEESGPRLEVAVWHTSVSAKTASTPAKIGHFVLLELIGAGSMGEVYAAYDNQLDRKVALKVVHPTRGPSTQARASACGARLRRWRDFPTPT